jgi:hypothetical protein
MSGLVDWDRYREAMLVEHLVVRWLYSYEHTFMNANSF